MRYAILSAIALVLVGCASNPLPDDYAGQTALVKDSHANYVEQDGMKAEHVELFAMMYVDGKLIKNGLSNTMAATMQSPNGMMIIVGGERRVPVKSLKVDLVGQVYSSSLLGPATRKTERSVSFTPLAGGTYVVRGRLAESGSDVWIETAGGKRVTQ
jgi:hypothetical protein